MVTSKTYKKVGIEDLEPALEILDLSRRELAEKLGYEATALGNWFKRGTMPEVAAVALRGLLLEAGAELPKEEEKPPEPVYSLERLSVVSGFCEMETLYRGRKPEELTLAGLKYLLIPLSE